MRTSRRDLDAAVWVLVAHVTARVISEGTISHSPAWPYRV